MLSSESSSSCSLSVSSYGGIVVAFWKRPNSKILPQFRQPRMPPPVPKMSSTAQIQTRSQTPSLPITRTSPVLNPHSLTALMTQTSSWVRQFVPPLLHKSHLSFTIRSTILNPSRRRAPMDQTSSKSHWFRRSIPPRPFRALTHCRAALNVVPTSASSTSPSLSQTRVPTPQLTISPNLITGIHT